jgi:hypothetical protein
MDQEQEQEQELAEAEAEGEGWQVAAAAAAAVREGGRKRVAVKRFGLDEMVAGTGKGRKKAKKARTKRELGGDEEEQQEGEFASDGAAVAVDEGTKPARKRGGGRRKKDEDEGADDESSGDEDPLYLRASRGGKDVLVRKDVKIPPPLPLAEFVSRDLGDSAPTVLHSLDLSSGSVAADVVAIWDFLSLLDVTSSKAFTAPVKEEPTKMAALGDEAGESPGIHPHNPLGGLNGRCPSVSELTSALASGTSEWLDAVAIRLVDMVYQDISRGVLEPSGGDVSSNVQGESAAVGTRPNSATWPEFLRQCIATLHLIWIESDGTGQVPTSAAQWMAGQHDRASGASLIDAVVEPESVNSAWGRRLALVAATKVNDAAVIAAIAEAVAEWRLQNQEAVQEEASIMTAEALVRERSPSPEPVSRRGLRSRGLEVSGQGFDMGLSPVTRPTYVPVSKYGRNALNAFLAQVEPAPECPKWARLLLSTRDMQSKNGAPIRNAINEAANYLEGEPKERLMVSVSEDVYRGNAAGKCRELCQSVLVDWMLDNPSAFTGINFDEEGHALLPETGERMKDLEPPPTPVLKVEAPVGRRQLRGYQDPGDLAVALLLSHAEAGRRSVMMCRLRGLVRFIALLPYSAPFLLPVDLKRHYDYKRIVRRPMDLKTIDQKLEEGKYGRNMQVAIDDIAQVWANACAYNEPETDVYITARHLEKVTDLLLQEWVLKPWQAVQASRNPSLANGEGKEGDVSTMLDLNAEVDQGEEEFVSDMERVLEELNVPLQGRHIDSLLQRVPWSEGCQFCGVDDHDRMLVCDGCDKEFHLACFDPPMRRVPKGEWHCESCSIKVSRGAKMCTPEESLAMSAELMTAAEKLIPLTPPELEMVEYVGLCRHILRHLAESPDNAQFLQPADPQKHPGYYQKVSDPLDFRTIDRRLASGYYEQTGEFQHNLWLKDVLSVAKNWQKYAAAEGEIKGAAVALRTETENLYKNWVVGLFEGEYEGPTPAEIKLKVWQAPKWDEGCLICGGDDLSEEAGDIQRCKECKDRWAHAKCLNLCKLDSEGADVGEDLQCPRCSGDAEKLAAMRQPALVALGLTPSLERRPGSLSAAGPDALASASREATKLRTVYRTREGAAAAERAASRPRIVLRPCNDCYVDRKSGLTCRVELEHNRDPDYNATKAEGRRGWCPPHGFWEWRQGALPDAEVVAAESDDEDGRRGSDAAAANSSEVGPANGSTAEVLPSLRSEPHANWGDLSPSLLGAVILRDVADVGLLEGVVTDYDGSNGLYTADFPPFSATADGGAEENGGGRHTAALKIKHVEQMDEAELRAAIDQSNVLFTASERGECLSADEVNASEQDVTSASFDPALMKAAARLRGMSFSELGAEERLTMLRLLVDLASGSGPISEHIGVVVGRSSKVLKEIISLKRELRRLDNKSSLSSTRKKKKARGPSKDSKPKYSADVHIPVCSHGHLPPYARGVCRNCYAAWRKEVQEAKAMKARLEEEEAAKVGLEGGEENSATHSRHEEPERSTRRRRAAPRSFYIDTESTDEEDPDEVAHKQEELKLEKQGIRSSIAALRERRRSLSPSTTNLGCDSMGTQYYMFRGASCMLFTVDRRGEWGVLDKDAVANLISALRKRLGLDEDGTSEADGSEGGPPVSYGPEGHLLRTLLELPSLTTPPAAEPEIEADTEPSSVGADVRAVGDAPFFSMAPCTLRDPNLVADTKGRRAKQCQTCCGSCSMYAAMVRRSKHMTDFPDVDGGHSSVIDCVRRALLAICSALPDEAFAKGFFHDGAVVLAWRAYVRHCSGPRELMQALLMLESVIGEKWLAKWWQAKWASPSVAMRLCTLQGVAYRAYALDAAIQYDGAGRAGSSDGRGRRGKGATSTLFRGAHMDNCEMCGLGGRLLCCDYCPRVYHLNCANMLSDPTTPTWACLECRRSR